MNCQHLMRVKPYQVQSRPHVPNASKQQSSITNHTTYAKLKYQKFWNSGVIMDEGSEPGLMILQSVCLLVASAASERNFFQKLDIITITI